MKFTLSSLGASFFTGEAKVAGTGLEVFIFCDNLLAKLQPPATGVSSFVAFFSGVASFLGCQMHANQNIYTTLHL
jgi:hypothetical protein